MSDWGATQRVSAEVVLADGAMLEGELHLAARATYSAATESPLEMLNRGDPFFPLTLQQGGVAFVSKAQVAVVSCRDQSPLDPDRASAARLVALEVSIIQTNRKTGMVTLNDALMELVDAKLVEPREAYMKAVEKTGFTASLKAKRHDVSFLGEG